MQLWGFAAVVLKMSWLLHLVTPWQQSYYLSSCRWWRPEGVILVSPIVTHTPSKITSPPSMNGCITQSDTTLLIKRHAPKYLLFVNAIFSLADYITVRLQMRSAVQCHMLYPMQQQACNAVVLLRSFVPCQQSEPIQSLFANCECFQSKNIANNEINYCTFLHSTYYASLLFFIKQAALILMRK